MSVRAVAVTGAWSYSGRWVAAELLARGFRVVSLTSRPVPDADPHRGLVEHRPYNFAPGGLARTLEDVDVLACGYWSRHEHRPIGHRGPWTSHALAVRRSRLLVEAAVRAGVRRLVWTSVANPGLDPDLSFYVGKAHVEGFVRQSGLPYAILRPPALFGPGALLVQNVVWAARHLPVVPIPDTGPVHVRPIHVEDYARAVADAVQSDLTYVQDAAGPDRVELVSLLHFAVLLVGGRLRPVRLSVPACVRVYRWASAVLRETVLSADEVVALSRNRLDSVEPPVGRIPLRIWLRDHVDSQGLRLFREPVRWNPRDR